MYCKTNPKLCNVLNKLNLRICFFHHNIERNRFRSGFFYIYSFVDSSQDSSLHSKQVETPSGLKTTTIHLIWATAGSMSPCIQTTPESPSRARKCCSWVLQILSHYNTPFGISGNSHTS